MSAVSLWEISLKAAIGKLVIKGFAPEDVPQACEDMGYTLMPLSAVESSSYHKLIATHHKDPFDRMLIWQAIQQDLTLISSDKNVQQYVSDGLKVSR